MSIVPPDNQGPFIPTTYVSNPKSKTPWVLLVVAVSIVSLAAIIISAIFVFGNSDTSAPSSNTNSESTEAASGYDRAYSVLKETWNTFPSSQKETTCKAWTGPFRDVFMASFLKSVTSNSDLLFEAGVTANDLESASTDFFNTTC